MRLRTLIASLSFLVASGAAFSQEKPAGPAPAPAAPPAKKPPPKAKKPPPAKKPPKPDAGDALDDSAGIAPVSGAAALGLKFGIASFSGDFSEDKAQTMLGLLSMVYPSAASGSRFKAPWALGFELRTVVDLEFTSAKQTGTYALGEPDETVNIMLFAVDVAGCFLADLPVQVCPYVGVGAIMATQGDDDHTLGTFPYGLLLPYKMNNIFSNFGLFAGGQLAFYGNRSKSAGTVATLDAGSLSAFAGLTF